MPGPWEKILEAVSCGAIPAITSPRLLEGPGQPVFHVTEINPNITVITLLNGYVFTWPRTDGDDVSGMDRDSKQWAQVLWDCLKLGQPLVKSDVIIGLGCHDIRVAERAANLYLADWAPLMLFTGYLGSHTSGKWDRPEADVFAETAVKLGVPVDKIILERRATNTGENIQFAHQTLKEKGIPVHKIILVQQPFMEHRVYATYLKQWPQDEGSVQAVVTSPIMELDDFPNEHVGNMNNLIGFMLGTLERIRDYPAKGFQVEQKMSPEVYNAYEKLLQAGYQPY
uniref:uncharacterized protein SCO4629-like n=1 Tax=Pristiophorus japonicus TaxID=55135 RepID=UPI00398F37D2